MGKASKLHNKKIANRNQKKKEDWNKKKKVLIAKLKELEQNQQPKEEPKLQPIILPNSGY